MIDVVFYAERKLDAREANDETLRARLQKTEDARSDAEAQLRAADARRWAQMPL